MILGIDASNIRVGGGVTHLVEMLRSADPKKSGFSKVIVWAGKRTLDRIEDRSDWLKKVHISDLDGGLIKRVLWQKFSLTPLVLKAECDLLFVPGGNYTGGFSPFVAMSQNLLPFEWRELKRYGVTWMAVKMLMLRVLQAKTFRRANGVLFLTNYAKCAVGSVVGSFSGLLRTIPLGIGDVFFSNPAAELPGHPFSQSRPCRILYVSVVDVYKHQWHVAQAVADLRARGMPVTLDLVGPSVEKSLRRLQRTLAEVDPNGDFIRYRGPVPHQELAQLYRSSDLNVFASSCENMPNILLESMASGIPVACSKLGPMSEVLGDAGVYFDPERPSEISDAIECLFNSETLRQDNAKKALVLVRAYSWSKCSDESFSFFKDVVDKYSKATVVS